MPRLGQSNIVELTLPSSTADDPAVVSLNRNLEAGVVLDAVNGLDARQATVVALSVMIVDWNFTDENGQKVPVTPENVRRLSFADFNFLDQKAKEAMESTLKKELPDSEKKSLILALSAAYDGRKVDVPLSLDYQIHLWRRRMHVSYQEARITPLAVIMRDLEYLDIEGQVSNGKQQQQSNAKPGRR